MKKFFSTLLLVLFVTSLSFAQVNKNWDGTKPEVYKGSKNFIFLYSPFVSSDFKGAYAGSYTNPNFNTDGTFDSTSLGITPKYGIGFQYFATDQIALALGVSFGTGSRTLTFLAPGESEKASETIITFSLDGNYHLKSLYSVSPYIGLNVHYGTYSGNYDHTSTLAGGTYSGKMTGSSIGFGLNLGFDWYFAPGISLGGKYLLGYESFSAPTQTYTNTGVSHIHTGASESGFGTGSASIMLNVHF